MPVERCGAGDPCPWCHEGRIVVHGPQEEWWVIEEGAGSTGSHTGRFPAGIRRRRFKAPPVEWFSCTRCAMTGTTSYLATVVRQMAGHRVPVSHRASGSAVRRGRLASALS